MYKAACVLSALVAATMFPALVAAQPVECPLFPAVQGNQWTFITESGPPDMVTVSVSESPNRANLHRVDNFLFPLSTDPVYLLNDACAKTIEVDKRVWHQIPDVPERPTPSSAVDGMWYYCRYSCQQGMEYKLPRIGGDVFDGVAARIVNVGMQVTVPAGTFADAVMILYESPNDFLITETLAPYVGLVRRVVQDTSIDPPGPIQVYSLCSAVVNGIVIGGPMYCITDPDERANAVEQTTWGAVKSTFR